MKKGWNSGQIAQRGQQMAAISAGAEPMSKQALFFRFFKPHPGSCLRNGRNDGI